MKNKKLTYILGLFVLVVWGMIIYRIFSAAGSGEEEGFKNLSTNVSKRPYNDFNIPKDTVHLLLNYRDPFGLTRQKDTVKHIDKKPAQVKTVQQPVKVAFNWSFVKYTGYIRNPGSKKLIAIISINGTTEMMAEGETSGKLKLIKNMQDSIKISFDGKTTFIKIRPDAL